MQSIASGLHGIDHLFLRASYNHVATKTDSRGKVHYTRDDFRRVTGIHYDDATEPRFTYDYGANGQVAYVRDNELNRTVWTEYDTSERPTRTHILESASSSSIGTPKYVNTVRYDAYGNVDSYKETVNNSANFETTYIHDVENRPTQLRYYHYDMTDAIGNLTSYVSWTYTWEQGRRLIKQIQDSKTVEYTYDASGLRIRKKYNSTISDYTWVGGKLVHLKAGSQDMHFFYDAEGMPAMVLYNQTPYWYVRNLQGDIIALVDTSGTTVVEYKYDPWGKKESVTGTLASSVGWYNPFRYRGYIFDEETLMYYLKDRYYYPELRRFISADTCEFKGYESVFHNLYTYCINTPTGFVDRNGRECVPNYYLSQYFIMQAYDYRSCIVDAMATHGYNETKLNAMGDMEIYDHLVEEVANTMTYNVEKQHMAIPNNTDWMVLLQKIVTHSSAYYKSGRYYARDIANACLRRYETETGSKYSILADKIALEIRLHYNMYKVLLSLGIDELHTRITDVSPAEGNVFQKVIDLLYSFNVK